MKSIKQWIPVLLGCSLAMTAQAAVIDAADTGIRQGAELYFVVELKLQVRPEPGLSAFETAIRVPISPVRMADFAQGRDIRVRVDPHTREVVVDQRVR